MLSLRGYRVQLPAKSSSSPPPLIAPSCDNTSFEYSGHSAVPGAVETSQKTQEGGAATPPPGSADLAQQRRHSVVSSPSACPAFFVVFVFRDQCQGPKFDC